MNGIYFYTELLQQCHTDGVKIHLNSVETPQVIHIPLQSRMLDVLP